jgi:hypothetical protein
MKRASRPRPVLVAVAITITFAIGFSGCQNPAKVRSFCYIPEKINDVTHQPNPSLPCATTGVTRILAGSRCLDTLISGPTQTTSAYGEDLCCYQATLADDCDPDL